MTKSHLLESVMIFAMPSLRHLLPISLPVLLALVSVTPPVEAQSSDSRPSSMTADQYYERGAAKKDREDYAGAYQDLTMAIRLDPKHYKAYSKRCAVLINSRRDEEALPDCERALAINPRYFRALYNRGLIRKENGDPAGALRDFNQALKINPRYGLAYLARGRMRAVSGDERGALSDFTRAIETSDREYCTVCAYQERGDLRLKVREFAGAEADYTYVLDQYPRDASVLMGRGVARFGLGKSDAGRQDLLKAAQFRRQAGDEAFSALILELLRKLEGAPKLQVQV